MKEVEKKIKEIYEVIDSAPEINRHDVFGGTAGVTLFCFYYAKYMDDADSYDFAMNSLSLTIDFLNNIDTPYILSNGMAGICWSIEHLSQSDFFEANTEEFFADIDEYFYVVMMEEVKNGNFDYLHGALGIAYYFLSRISSGSNRHYLENFVDELNSISVKEHGVVKWKSILDVVKQKQGYNISLSHGISSIVIFLSKAVTFGIRTDKAKLLINGAITYILSQKLPKEGFRSIFPSWSMESAEKIEISRLAWCYGDLGIAVALWHASQALSNKQWESEAVNILLHSAKRRDLFENSVVDAGLCHGTAGIAHVFKRMYRYTGLEELNDASKYWIEQTLEMATFNDGLAGYKAYRPKNSGGWTNEIGLLEGIAGIGLALISAVSDIEPAWDECLLLS